ncbi:MAG TPA: PorV/PorQ family protein [bacterium]|nr:PorV/PorQ family protein [bacterium]HPN33020.1 PorV/PorQ family protein [bacterium]
MKYKRLICLFTVLCLAVTAEAQMKKVAQSKMQFLKLGIGARAAGMGDAFIAISGDPNAIFYNPAGCAGVQGVALALNQNNWLVDIDHKSGVLTYNTGRYGVFIADYIAVDYGTMERTIVDAHAWEGYQSQGTFSASEYAIGLGYAIGITDRFSLGGQIKYAYQDLAASQVWQYLRTEFENTRQVKNETDVVAYDFGTYYNSGYKNIRIGMSVQNFANKPIPLTFRFGVAMDVNQLLIPDHPQHVLTLTADALHPKDYSERMHFGLEYVYNNLFSLRGGYKLNYDEESYSGGVGIRTTVQSLHFEFNYAATDFGVFGLVNRFSLNFQL